MPDEATIATDKLICFGPFRLFPTQQLLLENEKPLRLGGRAFDILLALIERAGELVTKEELVAKVWPNTFVEESSLRVHMAALRRTLGDSQAGNRFIATTPGRGYTFVGKLSSVEAQGPHQAVSLMERHTHNLPVLPTRVLGRSANIESVRNSLREWRFVTLLGAGGIGKTTLALAVAEAELAQFPDQVCFVNLAPLSDAALVPSSVALELSCSTRSDHPLEELIFFLGKKRILLVLDNCEHVIGAAATLAERIFESAPGVYILATSREPLHAAGEHVYRLQSLGLPPTSSAITAADAIRYPAIQLFVERAKAVVDEFELNDHNASIVSEICRRLDGIPLAIEMAASRVNAVALNELAAQLNNRFSILSRGRRTASQRHQTLRATLDWSYDQLPQVEQTIFSRIAVFPGTFSLDSASILAVNGQVNLNDVVPGIANLVEKSLIVAELNNVGVHYRLFDSTRAYALEKLVQSGEHEEFLRRHAEYYCKLCERAELESETTPTAEWLATYRAAEIDNFRSALDWAFSPNGDAALAVRLTVAIIPLWLQLSLIEECRIGLERTLPLLDETEQSARPKMKIFTALGWALLYKNVAASRNACASALNLAETLDDTEYRLRALWGMWRISLTVGDFNNSLALAQRFQDVAATSMNPSDLAAADLEMGATLHFIGDQISAEKYTRRALQHYVASEYRSNLVRFQFDQQASARVVLARILWLKGLADQAMCETTKNVEYAGSINPTSLCMVLAHAACPIALNNGDLETAERYISMLLQHAEPNAQRYLRAYGKGFKGVTLIRRGSVDAGLRLCCCAVDTLRTAQSVIHLTAFLIRLAEGACEAGKLEQGFAAIDEALERCERYGGRWCMAEVLRVKGEMIRRSPAPDAVALAEDCFRKSLELANHQGALSWELRTATSLARLHRDQGQVDQARDLLTSIYSRFQEGFGTADLVAANELLKSMN